jgi:hypothetical protein
LRSGVESFARPGGAAVSTCLLDMLRVQYPQTDALNDNVGTLHIIIEYIHGKGGWPPTSCVNGVGACGWGSSLWLCALKLLAGPFLTGKGLAWHDFLYTVRRAAVESERGPCP